MSNTDVITPPSSSQPGRLLDSLLEPEIKLLRDHGQRLRFAPQQSLFHEGDPGNGLYLIEQGDLGVYKSFGGTTLEVARLSAGDCVGEISLISGQRRTATVTALTPVTCLVVSLDDLNRLMVTNSGFSLKLMQLLSARLIDSAKTADQQIIEAYQTLIFSLSDMAESRDPETGEHLLRVQNYCRRLAEMLQQTERFGDQISDQFIEHITVVSPLHDIGKVGIPDHILLKPGKLSAEEFEIMKQHSAIGAKTLLRVLNKSGNPIFSMAYHVILHHHDRYDGTGYPTGLKGEAIPLEARIMALADVYDALLSKRVYKEAFDYQRAKAILEEGCGSHFDPFICRLMLDNIGEFEAIHRQFADR